MVISIQSSTAPGTMSRTEQATKAVQDTFRKLASGIRGEQGSGSSSLLAIADRFTSQVRGINQARSNVNDGVSMVQVADSGLEEIQSSFQRIRELAVQGANGALSDSDRQALQAEAEQLQEQVDSLVKDTEFNGVSLLAAGQPVSLQTGPGEGDRTVLHFQDFSSAFAGFDLSTQAGAEGAVAALDGNLEIVGQARSQLGSVQSNLAAQLESLGSSVESLTAPRSRIQSSDFAGEISALVSARVRDNALMAVQTQANQDPARVMGLL
ncbi:MAG: hypothetical protein HQL59_04000 [Magnetococcales bacterium]|nr:hypothetical protein [Magnetococcales bacterium]